MHNSETMKKIIKAPIKAKIVFIYINFAAVYQIHLPSPSKVVRLILGSFIGLFKLVLLYLNYLFKRSEMTSPWFKISKAVSESTGLLSRKP